MLGEPAEAPAAEIARAQAFDLLESYNDIPVQGAELRAEPGAACGGTSRAKAKNARHANATDLRVPLVEFEGR